MIIPDVTMPYSIETRLTKKLDIMIDRCEQKHPKKDAVLIIEGAEGEGKTNTSLACGYYITKHTGRTMYIFFDLLALINFAKSNFDKVIIWDEPALDALKTDWYRNTNSNLMRLLMMARKNRHFFLFNFTKFYKFSEYIVVDRALGLVHMYSRNEIEPGRFVYIRKRNLEHLYLGWTRSKKRLYKKYSSFRGKFPDVEKYFDEMDITVVGIDGIFYEHASYNTYEIEKDKAIKSIGTTKPKEKDKYQEDLYALQAKLSKLKYPIKNGVELAAQLEVTRRIVGYWGQRDLKLKESEENNEKTSENEVLDTTDEPILTK
jgi:hypothetical protein